MAVEKKIYNEGEKPMAYMDKIYQMGMEAAFSGIDPKRFNARDKKEEKIFLEGYKNGLEIQQNNKDEQELKVA